MFDTNGEHLKTPLLHTTYQVWVMKPVGRKKYTARLVKRDFDPAVAQQVAQQQMLEHPKAYVYIRAWTSVAKESKVTWDSLSGWYVQGDPTRAIRSILRCGR